MGWVKYGCIILILWMMQIAIELWIGIMYLVIRIGELERTWMLMRDEKNN